MVVYGLKLHTKHKNISALLFNRCEHWWILHFNCKYLNRPKNHLTSNEIKIQYSIQTKMHILCYTIYLCIYCCNHIKNAVFFSSCQNGRKLKLEKPNQTKWNKANMNQHIFVWLVPQKINGLVIFFCLKQYVLYMCEWSIKIVNFAAFHRWILYCAKVNDDIIRSHTGTSSAFVCIQNNISIYYELYPIFDITVWEPSPPLSLSLFIFFSAKDVH